MKKAVGKIEIAVAGPEEEISVEFLQGMVNRMMVSHFKYGAVRDKYPLRADAIANCMERIAKYQETGNTEWLMDAANYCMIEFMCPGHPEAHFRATGSDESPGNILRDGTQSHGQIKRKQRDGD